MRRGRIILAGLLILATGLLPMMAEAGLGKAAMRGAWRSSTRRFGGRSAGQVMRRDLVRDRAIKARPLSNPRTVFRYTSKAQARTELRRGILPGRHMTARGGPGRPLGASTAQRRYGLPGRPQVRETIRLPKGQPIRTAKAVGGGPGVGELTSTRRVPPTAITNLVRQ